MGAMPPVGVPGRTVRASYQGNEYKQPSVPNIPPRHTQAPQDGSHVGVLHQVPAIPLETLPPLIEAASAFTSRAAEKLRQQDGQAGALLVFAHTSPFREGPRLNASLTVPLRRPTADTAELVQAATRGLRRIWQPGYKLSKAGVMLLDLAPASKEQRELQLEDDYSEDRTRLMTALDALNQRYGKGTVHVASTGLDNDTRQWGMRQERRTPQYTTRWEDIPTARA